MDITVGILLLIIAILFIYIILIKSQIQNINRQLTKRLTKNTRQPVSLEMMSKELNTLTANINKCLKVEESLRLNGIRADKKLKELVANISHDLRTPLTAIKGYQQLMEKDELTEEQQKRLGIAQKHTEELGQLIEHFFEYSFLLNVEPEVNLEQMNLTNIVTECLVASIPALEEKNLMIKLVETPPVFALADIEMVMRIIQNLIRNCIQHSNGCIEVRLMSQENITIVSFRNPVKDTSQIDVEQMFDRFYTGDQSRSNHTGLGLAIVRILAQQMGGSVGATLEDGVLDIWVKFMAENITHTT